MQFDVNGLSVTKLLDDTDGLAKISDDNKVYIIPSHTFPLPDDSEQASIALTTFLDDEDDDDYNSPSPDNVQPESVTIYVGNNKRENIDRAFREMKKILKQDFVKETVCSLAVVCTCLWISWHVPQAKFRNSEEPPQVLTASRSIIIFFFFIVRKIFLLDNMKSL